MEDDPGELRRRFRAERLDEGPPLGLTREFDPEPTAGAVRSAEDTPWVGFHAVQQCADRDVSDDGEDALAAEPAAPLTGTAGIRQQPVLLDNEGRVAGLE